MTVVHSFILEAPVAHGPRVRWLALGALLLLMLPSEATETSLRTQANALFKPLPQDMATPETPLTPERIRLGRQLFFEPRASADGAVSCARCHQPALYGTDALPKSIGANNHN